MISKPVSENFTFNDSTGGKKKSLAPTQSIKSNQIFASNQNPQKVTPTMKEQTPLPQKRYPTEIDGKDICPFP